MKRKIGIKELHNMASQMKYYDFENWLAKELFDQPETANTSELTDKLFLHNVVGQSEQLVCDCGRAEINRLSGICEICWNEKFPDEAN
jgi:hypothetical protein